MSTISPHRSVVSPSENGQLLLCNGDRMKQPEFHRRYETYPKDVKFELIGGIVYMASPLRMPHGRYQPMLSLRSPCIRARRRALKSRTTPRSSWARRASRNPISCCAS